MVCVGANPGGNGVVANPRPDRKSTGSRATAMAARDEDRAALGLYLSVTGNKRDTSGVFVQRVSDGGPADKAGIAEGDRIASINGVDVRVPREDAGDWSVGSSRIDRLEREVRKLKPGQTADLVIVSGSAMFRPAMIFNRAIILACRCLGGVKTG